MKQTVNYYTFAQAFRDYDRFDQFGGAALSALFDYLEELEQDTGEEMELDVIALCCDWTRYDSAVEACSEYDTGIETRKTVYTAGWNMRGYMPDSEPAQFDDIEDAREYIADMMEDYADILAERQEYKAETLRDIRDGMVSDLREAAEQVRQGTGELGVTVAGWHYWITSETVDNEEAEEQCLEWLRDNTQVIETGNGTEIMVMAF